MSLRNLQNLSKQLDFNEKDFTVDYSLQLEKNFNSRTSKETKNY